MAVKSGGISVSSSFQGWGGLQLIRVIARLAWTFNHPDNTENTLRRWCWVTIANSDFKSCRKTETLSMFFTFFPTLAAHLILTLWVQFPES